MAKTKRSSTPATRRAKKQQTEGTQAILAPRRWFARPEITARLNAAKRDADWHQVYWKLQDEYEHEWSKQASVLQERWKAATDTLQRDGVLQEARE